MRYIPADKLKAEIERRKDIYIGHALCLKETNLIDGFNEALNIIKSLQQEQHTGWSGEYVDLFNLLYTIARRCINDDSWDYTKRVKVSKDVLPFIDRLKFLCAHLQQEQPDKSFCEENCKGYKDTGGKCFFGFNCSAKKAQEQPEVDLEKIKNLIRAALNGVTRLGSLCDDQTIEHAVDNLIDKLGLNARKEK